MSMADSNPLAIGSGQVAELRRHQSSKGELHHALTLQSFSCTQPPVGGVGGGGVGLGGVGEGGVGLGGVGEGGVGVGEDPMAYSNAAVSPAKHSWAPGKMSLAGGANPPLPPP